MGSESKLLLLKPWLALLVPVGVQTNLQLPVWDPNRSPSDVALFTEGLVGEVGARWTLQSSVRGGWMGHGMPGSKPLVPRPINKAIQEQHKVTPNKIQKSPINKLFHYVAEYVCPRASFLKTGLEIATEIWLLNSSD